MINSEMEIEKLEVWNGPSRPPYLGHRIYTVRLTIRASVNVNNTKLQCEAILHTGSHDTVKSSHAKLLVLTGDNNC